MILPNDFWGKSSASVRIDHTWFERFMRSDGWDEWYEMEDTFTVVATGTTILSRTWSVIGGAGSYRYASDPTSSNTFTVISHEYLYGGQIGPLARVRCVVVTTAGTFTVESS